MLGRRREEEAEGESERDRLAEGRSFDGELGVEEMEVDSTAPEGNDGDPGMRMSPSGLLLLLFSIEEAAGRRGKAST